MSDASKETLAGSPEGPPGPPVQESLFPPVEGADAPVGPEPTSAPAALDPALALAAANDLLAKARLLVEAAQGGAAESEEAKAAREEREAEVIRARIPNVKNLATHRRYIPDRDEVKVVTHDGPVTPNTAHFTAQTIAAEQLEARKLLAAERQAYGESLPRRSKERLKAVKQEAIRKLFVPNSVGPRYSPTSIRTDDGTDRYITARFNPDTGEHEYVDTGAALLGYEAVTASLNPETREEIKAVEHIKHAAHKAEAYRRARTTIEAPLYHRLMPKQVGLTDAEAGFDDKKLDKAIKYDRNGYKAADQTAPGLQTYKELPMETRMEMLIRSPGLTNAERKMHQKRLDGIRKNRALEDKWTKIGVIDEGHHKQWHKPWTWKSHGHSGGHDAPHAPTPHSRLTPTVLNAAPKVRIPRLRNIAQKAASVPSRIKTKLVTEAQRDTARYNEAHSDNLYHAAQKLERQAAHHRNGLDKNGEATNKDVSKKAANKQQKANKYYLRIDEIEKKLRERNAPPPSP